MCWLFKSLLHSQIVVTFIQWPNCSKALIEMEGHQAIKSPTNSQQIHKPDIFEGGSASETSVLISGSIFHQPLKEVQTSLNIRHPIHSLG